MTRSPRLLAPLLAATLVTLASAATPPLPFHLPTPEGWRTETIPFPLSFAPELVYTGLEELRFAPGMFREGAEDFFTYAFVWVTEEPLPLDPARLADDLEIYFEGLGAAVRKGKELPPLNLELPGRLQATRDGRTLVGTAAAFDAFVTQAELRLNVRVRAIAPPPGHRGALVFTLSPRPLDHPVWDTLRAIEAGYAPAPGGEA